MIRPVAWLMVLALVVPLAGCSKGKTVGGIYKATPSGLQYRDEVVGNGAGA